MGIVPQIKINSISSNQHYFRLMTTALLRSQLFVFLYALCFALEMPGHSQDADSSTSNQPTRPYLGTLRDNFTFVKKFVYKPRPQSSNPTNSQTNAPSQEPPNLAEFDSIQTKPLRKDVEIFVDGTSKEIWRSGDLRFVVPSAHPDSVIVESNTLSYYVDPADFEELKWIGAGFFHGEQTIGDKKYYVYKNGAQVALIDEATRLPLSYDSDLVHVTYTYGVPDSPLTMPTNCAKKLHQMQRSWSGLPN